MEQPAVGDDQRAEVGVRADLFADPVARHDAGLDAHEGEVLPGVLELPDVRWCVRQLEVADLAEVAVDRLVGDQPLDGLVAVEGLAIERPPGVLAVAGDQLARAPLVAGMDDPAVPGRRPEAERLGLEQRDRDPAAGQLPRRVDARVSAADHDDVGACPAAAARIGRAAPASWPARRIAARSRD